MAGLALDPIDEQRLAGEEGEASRLAMRVLVAMARATDAERFIDVEAAHVDGCLYHGQVSLDFAERLASAGARVAVPTTLNVGAVDLLHPGRFRGDPAVGAAGRRLMERYVGMGCRPTFTCAPYQLPDRPRRGQHVAWAESNAIVFANSVLGARTARYGDFIDICAAITGRVPDAGLHRDEHRRGQVLFRLAPLPDRLASSDVLYPVLGHLVGSEAGTLVPVIEGLPSVATEDQLKALGAGAASSGSVGLFHAVGVTPEAPTLEAAFGGATPLRTVEVTLDRLVAARDELSTAAGPGIDAVSVGTPHASIAELEQLAALVDSASVHAGMALFVSTDRATLAEAEARGWVEALERAGATFVVDTCTYVTPILDARARVVMTNSAKWAYYAPGNLGVAVVFGSLEECVRSATLGRVWRDPNLWSDGG